jgi:hypothetical protein
MAVQYLRLTFALILSISFKLSFSQKETKVETDSSFISTSIYPDANAILIYNELKDNSKTYFTELYYDTKTINQQGAFVGNYSAGIWKEFYPVGKVKRIIDYDKAQIIYFDKIAFPFLELKNSYKLKADSILKKFYSEEFIAKHIIWCIDNSSISNLEESRGWTEEEPDQKPTEFSFGYIIMLDNKPYYDLLGFDIDENAQLIHIQYDLTSGFEQFSKGSPKSFTITHKGALEMAKQKGLVETETTKAEAYLLWERSESNNIYNGKFRFYVTLKTATIRQSKPMDRYSITDKYDVYIFNPWTSEFIEKRKMKTVENWSTQCGYKSDLVPDDECNMFILIP